MPLFQETTIEMARTAARAINEFMSHWNDDLLPSPRPFFSNTFQNATVATIERILATPEQGSGVLWKAHFYSGVQPLLFVIDNEKVSFPCTRSFFADELFVDELEGK